MNESHCRCPGCGECSAHANAPKLKAEIKRLKAAAQRQWVGPLKPLTAEQKLDLATNWFSEDWSIKNALGMLDDYEAVYGIKEKKK